MTTLEMPITMIWSDVQQMRDEVQEHLAALPEDVCTAAVMVASEMIENAIKYGQNVPHTQRATIRIEHNEDMIKIIVKNSVANESTINDLQRHVERIAGASDRLALYTDRLRELMKSGGQGSSKLGLYRIGCEGGFDLQCDYADGIATVVATRHLSPP